MRALATASRADGVWVTIQLARASGSTLSAADDLLSAVEPVVATFRQLWFEEDDGLISFIVKDNIGGLRHGEKGPR